MRSLCWRIPFFLSRPAADSPGAGLWVRGRRTMTPRAQEETRCLGFPVPPTVAPVSACRRLGPRAGGARATPWPCTSGFGRAAAQPWYRCGGHSGMDALGASCGSHAVSLGETRAAGHLAARVACATAGHAPRCSLHGTPGRVEAVRSAARRCRYGCRTRPAPWRAFAAVSPRHWRAGWRRRSG